MIITLQSKFNPGDKVTFHDPCSTSSGVISEVKYDEVYKGFQYKIEGYNCWFDQGELEVCEC